MSLLPHLHSKLKKLAEKENSSVSRTAENILIEHFKEIDIEDEINAKKKKETQDLGIKHVDEMYERIVEKKEKEA